jgi:hypothetical protein
VPTSTHESVTEEIAVNIAPPAAASADTTAGDSPNAAYPSASEPQPAFVPPRTANTTPPADRPASKVAEPPRNINTPPLAATQPEPTLDVADLKSRLRDTNAIGVFTKLALKNQMDDLVQQFRTHHHSGQKSGVAPLRQLYDTLVLKVLSVIEGRDPSLARAISGSREAIWGLLADPIKFSSII